MSFKLFDLHKRRSVAQLVRHGGVPTRRFLARIKQKAGKRVRVNTVENALLIAKTGFPDL
ncbi:hypothetical protein [Pseudomonas frederiksbergensis]|uniref:hypothetical protein n=1 Tax=Pseudomonas frederiksbergensis TaxID=104087 RepID=UPI0011CD808E|nr:hypothetical protein [Pseudomonas frederiksbergensis]